MCYECNVHACPKHGSKTGAGSKYFKCADCAGVQALWDGTSDPPPGGRNQPGPPGSPPHPQSVLWALSELSRVIADLRPLFERERLAQAAEIVVDDRRTYQPVELGRALGARILGALNEQDLVTIGRALAVDRDDVARTEPETLSFIASSRAGALSLELTAELSERRPRQPTPASTDHLGSPVDDLTLITDGLAALCAAHGYESAVVHGGALNSPFDIPGALYLPAYGLQMLFAYIDQGGLGPYTGALRAPLGQGSTSSSMAGSSGSERPVATA